MTSDPTLKRFYCWANRQWFGGELRDLTIYWESTGRGCAETRELDEGELLIRVDPAISLMDKNWKLAVAHEMGHVELWPYKGHGRKFDEVMKRLCGHRSYRNLL